MTYLVTAVCIYIGSIISVYGLGGSTEVALGMATGGSLALASHWLNYGRKSREPCNSATTIPPRTG